MPASVCSSVVEGWRCACIILIQVLFDKPFERAWWHPWVCAPQTLPGNNAYIGLCAWSHGSSCGAPKGISLGPTELHMPCSTLAMHLECVC